MATIEKRVQALEQENAMRKHTEEMLTIAVRALASKEALEKLQATVEAHQEQNGKLFNVLINQNTLHNQRITELDGRVTKLDDKVTKLDGKVIGLQTEMRQRFTQIETVQQEQSATLDQFVQTQQEHTVALREQKDLLTAILARLPERS